MCDMGPFHITYSPLPSSPCVSALSLVPSLNVHSAWLPRALSVVVRVSVSLSERSLWCVSTSVTKAY